MHACRFNECYCKPFDDQSTYQIRARNDPCDETGHGILVVDESNSGGKKVQKAAVY